MRIRTVKPEFFTDDKMRSLPYETRLLFVGLWCFADDEGRFRDDRQLIKALIFPSDDVDVAKKLRELQKEKLIRRYRVGKKDYFLIPNWKRHQRINRPSKPRTPPPITRLPHKKKPHGDTRGVLTERSCRLKRKGREGKGKESVSQSDSPGKSHADARGETIDGQVDGAILETLEPFFPRASIERLALTYPPERLLWVAERTEAASKTGRVKKLASYFLRIVRDDDQWERYICDQYALGRAEALKRQRELGIQRTRQREAVKKRGHEGAQAAFHKYISTVPVRMRNAATAYVLRQWARENGIDLKKYREKGWLLKRAVKALYEEHVRRAWLALGRPAEYTQGHLKFPGKTEVTK